MPFRPPTDYYCEELATIDEQICELLAKRKELSNNNPGFPILELISSWSQKFVLNEDWLRMIFSVFMHGEDRLLSPVEPAGFLKFVPILRSVVIDNMMYAVTHMKQYSNASVVYIETEVNIAEAFVRLGHASFELFISPEYQCRQSSGCGHGKGMQHSFVVIPALPDNINGLEFRLSVKPLRENPEFQEVQFTETTVTLTQPS
jgi:hypothetical protein